jgi:hypothetical protein
MSNPYTIVDGQKVDDPLWDAIQDAWRATGLPADGLRIAQGSYKGGAGASASAGTHDGAGVVDIRTRTITHEQAIDFVIELRRRGVIAWFRAPEYGWTKTGEHIHAVFRPFRNMGMAPGAQRQLDSYDEGRNGLANGGKDPHYRPAELGWPLPSTATVKMNDLVVGRKSISAMLVLDALRRSPWWKAYLIGTPPNVWSSRVDTAVKRYMRKNNVTFTDAVRGWVGKRVKVQ